MDEALWQRDDDWVGTDVDGRFVMVHVDTGAYVTLNATASVVWEAMESPVAQPAIEAALLKRYDVDAQQCRAAVTGLLDEMRALGLAAPR